MTAVPEIYLREVALDDIAIFYEQQLDPEASEMAAFPPRSRDGHAAHWERIGSDANVVTRAIVADGEVVGNVGSWIQDGHREIGYWLGRKHWGRGIATTALALFVAEVTHRPLVAWVAEHNRASIRVLEKVGFTVSPNQPEPEPAGVRYVVMELPT
jgi:RimJ/RimL family protein N-acetyltransferase